MKLLSISPRSGFTLVELLVVITIIGILSSLSIVSLNTARQRARDAARRNDLRQIYTSLSLYYDSVSPPAYPDMSDVNGWWSAIVPKYLQSIPMDPLRRGQYYNVINNSSDTQKFCLYTTLEADKTILIETEAGMRTRNAAPELLENCYD